MTIPNPATRAAALALVLGGALATAAEAAREVHHVADVDGDLYIGVAIAENPNVEGNRALAVYLCDDAGAFRWLFGIASADAVAFEASDMRVSLDFTGDNVRGVIAREGAEPAAFELAESATEQAGIFGPQGYTGGWIVLNDGSQRGAVAFREQVRQPPLDPGAGSAVIDGEVIVAERDLGLEDCFPEPSGRCRAQ